MTDKPNEAKPMTEERLAELLTNYAILHTDWPEGAELDRHILACEVTRLKARNAELDAAAAAMRDALEGLAGGWTKDEHDPGSCYCCNRDGDAHKDTCDIIKALAPDAGKATLAELEELRAWQKDARRLDTLRKEAHVKTWEKIDELRAWGKDVVQTFVEYDDGGIHPPPFIQLPKPPASLESKE